MKYKYIWVILYSQWFVRIYRTMYKPNITCRRTLSFWCTRTHPSAPTRPHTDTSALSFSHIRMCSRSHYYCELYTAHVHALVDSIFSRSINRFCSLYRALFFSFFFFVRSLSRIVWRSHNAAVTYYAAVISFSRYHRHPPISPKIVHSPSARTRPSTRSRGWTLSKS